MMKKNSEILELVGHLQVTDQPLLSLYVTQSGNALFFFYRMTRNEYFLTQVTPHEVIAYLDEKLGLLQIYMESEDYVYRHRSSRSAMTSDFLEIDGARREEMQSRIKSFDRYDDVFGLDEIRVRRYLKDKMLSTSNEPHKELTYG